MDDLDRRLLFVGGVIVVTGALVAGFGLYEQQTTVCDPGSSFWITHLRPNESANAAFERDFEDLSMTHQSALRAQLPVKRTERIEDSAVIDGTLNTVVNYEGERYYISRVELDDCPPIGQRYRVGGALIVVIGGLVILPVVGRRTGRD